MTLRRALVSVVVAGVVAGGSLSLISGAGGAASTGALQAKGCIDDNDSGLDTCAKSTNGLDTTTGIAVSADGKSVYTVAEGDEAVVRFARNKRSGALKAKGCIDDNDSGLDNCSKSTNGLSGVTALTLSRDGKSLYAVSEGDSAVVRFKRNTHSGALKAKGCIDDEDTGGDCAVSTAGLGSATSIVVSPDGKSVYAGSEEDDAVVRFARNKKSGALTAKGCIDDSDFNTDPSQGEDTCSKSTDGLAQVGPLAISGDGKYLYVASEGEVAVGKFKRAKTGALKAKGCIQAASTVDDACDKSAVGLVKPEGLAISSDGKSLYVVSESEDAIVHFKRNLSTGGLSDKGCIEDHDVGVPVCSKHSPGLSENSSVVVSKDGKSVYVGSWNDDAVASFARDKGSGDLKFKGCIEDNDFGADPQQGEDNCAKATNGLYEVSGLALSPDGKSLYAVSEADNAIVRFKRAN
jgi:6-phosphogluconolactonase (cycloisomerase 2 family)